MKSGPEPLIENGQLVRRTMRREFMTYEELLSQLRLHGIQDPAEVQRAYLEPNGSISVVSKQRSESEPTETIQDVPEAGRSLHPPVFRQSARTSRQRGAPCADGCRSGRTGTYIVEHWAHSKHGSS